MAELIVSLLVKKLEAWVEQEVELLQGVSDDIRDIKDEFKSIGAFLRDTDAKSDTNLGVREWLKQVQEVASEVEVILEDYSLAHHMKGRDDSNQGCTGSVRGMFKGVVLCFKCLKTKRDIGTRIQAVKAKIDRIAERRQRYNISTSLQPCSIPYTTMLRDPREDALFLEESQLVGIDGPIKELISYLSETDPRLSVVSVYGMGGLGKTTLVKKVYDHHMVKKEFPYRAWITLSQVFDAINLLKDLFKQFFGKVEEMKQMELVNLKQEINSKLQGEKYIVVLDDIWTLDAWRALKNALPDDRKSCSRIIITTRFESVADLASREVYGHIYRLKPLDPDDSWKLFSAKAFNSHPYHVPVEVLRERSTKFLEKCNGLPLGLVAIGGLLSTKPPAEWHQVYRNFSSFMDGSRTSLVDDIRSVISFSYEDLPYHLKSCFLYLGNFPEDYSIKCSRLIRMWAAEGCVVREGQRDLTMEELAKPYLDELIKRSLLQVEVVNSRKRIRSCKVHDLIREFIIWKAASQNWATLVAGYQREGGLWDPADSSLHLRVMELGKTTLKYLPSQTLNLSYLRYLRVMREPFDITNMVIRKLKHIETLDLRGLYIWKLDNTILQLVQLRNLFIGKHSNLLGVKLPAGLYKLKKLEKLGVVCLDADEEEKNRLLVTELGTLTQLRKLSVCNFRKEDEFQLFASVEKMQFLLSFKVRGTFQLSHVFFSFSPSLQSLSMGGELNQLPCWISSLHNLESLVLENLIESNNFIESLEVLHSLLTLELGGIFESLSFSRGGFPSLKKFTLSVFRMRRMRVEKGAMPVIQSMHFSNNLDRDFKEAPSGLQYLTTLEDITLGCVSDEFGESIMRYSWTKEQVPQIFRGTSFVRAVIATIAVLRVKKKFLKRPGNPTRLLPFDFPPM